jgi:quinol monooxygenase YgiN
MISYLIDKGKERAVDKNGESSLGYPSLDLIGCLYYRLHEKQLDPHENLDSEIWEETEE